MTAERVVICGQGPSWARVDTAELAQVRNAGALIIAVNGAVEHAPADVFFTLDLSDENRERTREPVEGVHYVVAAPLDEPERLDHVTYLERVENDVPRDRPYRLRAGKEAPGGLAEDPGKIHTGNSAFGALNLAYHLGAVRVALLGVDGFGHERWDGTRNRCLEHMPDLFASAVPQLDERGIYVVNGSPESSVDCFPRLTSHDALDWLINGEGPWTGDSIVPPPRIPAQPPPTGDPVAEILANRRRAFADRERADFNTAPPGAKDET